MMTLSDQVRQAVRKSGLTRYRIYKMSGVDQATLLRFMAGAEIRTGTLNKLAAVLNITIVVKPRRQRKQNGKRIM